MGSNQYRSTWASDGAVAVATPDLMRHGRRRPPTTPQCLASFPTLQWLAPGSLARLFAASRFPTGVRCSSSAGLIYNDRGQMLLVRVIKRGWDIPGGHLDPGESPTEALVRETAEEAGIEVEGAEPAGYLLIKEPDQEPAFIGLHTARATGKPHPQPGWEDEVDAAAWVSDSQVHDLAGTRVWTPLWRYLRQDALHAQ